MLTLTIAQTKEDKNHMSKVLHTNAITHIVYVIFLYYSRHSFAVGIVNRPKETTDLLTRKLLKEL